MGLGVGEPYPLPGAGSPQGKGAQPLKCHQVAPGCWQCSPPPLTTSTTLARGPVVRQRLTDLTCRQAVMCVHLEEEDAEPVGEGIPGFGQKQAVRCAGSCQPACPRRGRQTQRRHTSVSDCTNLLPKSLYGWFLLCRNTVTNKSEDTSRGVFRKVLEAFWDNKGDVLTVNKQTGPPANIHFYRH